MLSAVTLKSLIAKYKSQEAQFSPDLNPTTVALMKAESLYVFAYLDALSKELRRMDDGSINVRLRDFLCARWLSIQYSNLTYSRHPFLPANQLCLKIAEAIAGEDAVCQVLMPTIVAMCRAPSDLKGETEEDGHFPVENFLLNIRNDTLIPAAEIFAYAEQDTALVFSDYQRSEAQLNYTLGTTDLERLGNMARPASQTYMDALRQWHKTRHNNNSLGFAINELATQLRKASNHDLTNERRGTETVANMDYCDTAILDFYKIWRKLPQSIKEQISSYRVLAIGNSGYSLESYFLTLFVRHPECPLTQQELRQQQIDNILNCAQQISDYLFAFLVQKPQLYTMPIDEALTTVNEVPTNLTFLCREATTALSHRTQMIDGNDTYLESPFYFLSPHYNIPEVPTVVAKQMIGTWADSIHSYSDLYRASSANSFLFHPVFELLKPRLALFPFDEANALNCLHLPYLNCNSETFQFVANAFDGHITQDNFLEIYTCLPKNQHAAFIELTFNQFAKQPDSFTKFQHIYAAFQDDPYLQSRLLDYSGILFQHFMMSPASLSEPQRNEFVALCALLSEHTHADVKVKSRDHLIRLITHYDLFIIGWKSVAADDLVFYLSHVQYRTFIRSLDDLRTVANLFSSDCLRHLIFSKFNAAQLGCSEEEFCDATKFCFELKPDGRPPAAHTRSQYRFSCAPPLIETKPVCGKRGKPVDATGDEKRMRGAYDSDSKESQSRKMRP